MLPFNDSWSQGVWTNSLSWASNTDVIVTKSKSKFGLQGKSRILPNPIFFLAEVLPIRITFSSCLSVMQISWTSECLMTQRYKKSWIFVFHFALSRGEQLVANHQWAWQSIYTKVIKWIHHNFPMSTSKINSMLLCICSVINHIWHQNFITTKKWHIRCS